MTELEEIIAAYEAMDDRAREEQLRQFKRAAADWPRQHLRLVTTSPAQVIPLKRAPNR